MSDMRLAEALEYQARSCDDLGSPFTARLCRVLATVIQSGTPLTDRLLNWPGDLGPQSESVPLRLTGAFHALRLLERGGLPSLYPPQAPSDAALAAGIATALETEAAFIDSFIDSPPQTNEVRRSVAILAAGHWLTKRYPLPFVSFELGASAGLNLIWDRAAVETPGGRLGAADPAFTLEPDWTGPLPAGPAPVAAERQGVDLNPLDPVADGIRLRAYLWPDQPERMALTEAAIAARLGHVDRADAIDWLAQKLDPRPGHLRLIYHTVAWQYFPVEAQARGTALIEAAGAKATDDSPLAWFAMENDGALRGAALTLRLWPGDRTIALGRADFHGRWVNWTAPND